MRWIHKMIAYFTRRATVPERAAEPKHDPAVEALADESRSIIARNTELVAEFAAVERALKGTKWTKVR